ncbi:18054_t:CDS:1, partial [Acaulospora morrowiae]
CSGLQRHETIKHSTYNLLPNHIQKIPDLELSHLKNVIVKELQKRLKNNYHAVGEQVFSLHCSENAFVGIFGAYITRYSPCGSFYICSFKGENAIKKIGLIFGKEHWYRRHYGNGQQSFVRLYVPKKQNMSVNHNQLQYNDENMNVQPKKKSKSRLSSNGEMTIEWRVTGFKDKENHEYRAGVLRICFFLDQCQF